MTPFRRPIEIYRNEGVGVLRHKVAQLLRKRAQDAYWRFRGTRTVTRGGVTATFLTATMSEARAIRRLLRLESPMLEDLLSELRPDDVFYDVGAHIGLYSCFAVNVLPDEQVVAFEPNAANIERLRRNLSYNGSPRVMNCALSNERGELEFDNPTLGRDELGGRGSIAPEASNGSITVEAYTADGLVEQGLLPLPTIVKIDVEGAEPLVIEGMADLLSHDSCRLIYCEVHREAEGRRSARSYGSTSEEVEDRVSSLGFDTERIHDRPAEFLLKGSKEP